MFPGSSQGLLDDIPGLPPIIMYMDNMYMPPDESQDQRATRPIGYPAPGATTPASGPQGSRGTRQVRRWGIGVAAGALLLCGGAAAGVALTGTSSPSGGPTGQAAVLNSTLSAASSPMSPATASALTATQSSPTTQAATAGARCGRASARLHAAGHPRAARAVRLACGHRLRALRILGGLHGQFTFDTKKGPRTLAYERGVVQSVTATAVVVRAKDGTTFTWNLVSSTVVRQNGKRAADNALSTGENVFAGGPVTGTTYDARLIVIRKSTSSPGSSSSPSPPASSSSPSPPASSS